MRMTNLFRVNRKITKLRVDPIKYLFHRLIILEKDEDEGKEVKNTQTEDHPPESRVLYTR